MFKLNRKTKLFLALLAIIAGVLAAFTLTNKEKAGLPTPKTITDINQIIPGQTTADQLENLEGKYATKTENGRIIILVGQNEPDRYSKIELKENIVADIIIRDTTKFEFNTLDQYQNKYGLPNKILYGPWQNSGFLSYLFLQPNFIIIAHQNTQEIVEVWKIPQNLGLEQFFQSYEGKFSTSPKINNQF